MTQPTKWHVYPMKRSVFAVHLRKVWVFSYPKCAWGKTHDQTGQMPRLIWVSDVCTGHFVDFVMLQQWFLPAQYNDQLGNGWSAARDDILITVLFNFWNVCINNAFNNTVPVTLMFIAFSTTVRSVISDAYFVKSPAVPALWIIRACSKSSLDLLAPFNISINRSLLAHSCKFDWSKTWLTTLILGLILSRSVLTFSKSVLFRAIKRRREDGTSFSASFWAIHLPRPRLAPVTTNSVLFWSRDPDILI